MNDKYKILHLEDMHTDAELVKRVLQKNHIAFEQLLVDSQEEYIQALNDFHPDVILCDHALPAFNSFEALKILKEKKINIPFIVITATMTDEIAMTIVKQGADDYILKDRLQRLPHAIINVIEKYRFEKERKLLINKAYNQEALSNQLSVELSEKLLLATKVAGIGIWEYIFNENKFVADDVLLSLYGITSAEFIGSYESWLQYIHPGDKERINREFRNALANHKSFHTEFRNVWPNGSVHFIRGVAMVRRDTAGNPISFIGTNQDITESKEASEELKWLNNRLLLATNSAGMGIWDWDIVNNHLTWDEGMHRLYKIDLMQFGSLYEGWISRLHPEDRKQTNEQIQMAISGEKDYDTEFRIIWSDESVHYIKATGMIERDDAGKAIRMIGTNQDITQKRESQLQVINNEKRYRALIENGADGVVILSADMKPIYISPSTERVLGYNEQALLQLDLFSLFHPDDSEELASVWKKVIDSPGVPVGGHTGRMLHQDGTWRWIEATVTNLLHDPAVNGIVDNFRDITQSKNAELAVRQSEAKFRAFFESSMDGILLTVTDGEIISANPAACEIFKMTEAEICATGRLGLADVADPRLLQLLQERQRTGRAKGELTLVRKGGGKFPGELTSAVFKDAYGQERTSMIVRDITVRKAAEERDTFKAKLLNTIGQAAISTDLAGTITYWNKAAEQMYGWSAEEALGKNIVELTPAQETKEQANEIMQQLMQGNSWEGEFLVQRKDGNIFPVFITNSPTYDQVNQLSGIIGISTDITGRKKAEAAIQESEAFNRGVLDSMSSHLAVINAAGIIIKVNKSWNTFALNNGATTLEKCSVGANYFEVCTSQTNGDDKVPGIVEEGIKKVLEGTLSEFYLEYPCHSPFEERWFYLRVKKFAYNEPLALIEHQYITERKKAEEKVIKTTNELKQTSNDLNRIMGSSLDVICTIDEEGRFVNVSAASESIWGYKPSELKGAAYINMVFKEDVEKSINTAAEVMNGISVTMFENCYIRKDGSIVPMLWSATWDDNDKLMYCIAKDATEKKRLENAFEMERKRFHNMFFQAPSSMGILKGPDHVFEQANNLYLKLIGKEDIIGKTVKEVLPEVEEQGFITLLDNVYKTGKTFVANEMLIKLDTRGNGELVDTYLNFIYQAYTNAEGMVEGIFFFAIDVTEQVLSRKKIEESESSYRQIVETAQEGIWMIDENNKTTFVNKKMCDILEYTEEEMMNTTNASFKDEEEQKNAVLQIERRKKGMRETHDSRYITKSGKQIWTHVSTNPVFDKEGAYKGALAMITDITNRKEQEIEIQKNSEEREILIQELIRSNKDLQQFTFITSHNFRSPLSNLIALLDLVDFKTLTTENREIVEMFKTSTQQLNKTINDLVKILIIKNNVNVDTADNNISDLLEDVCASLSHATKEIDWEINKDLQVENICFNKSYLESIIMNLLFNAIKYRSPDRPLQITVSTEQGPNGVRMTIKDNGIGIDLNRHRDRIFGLYQRFHTNPDSVGLGLFIVKSQIIALGGNIEVESEVDKGTSFYITFKEGKQAVNELNYRDEVPHF